MLRPLLVVLVLLAPQPGAAQDPVAATHGPSPAYRAFLQDLQDAVRFNRREQVLRLIDYPLRVNRYRPGGGAARTRFYRTPAAIRANYARIFTPQVRAAILNQRYDRLFAPSRGIMIGDGEVWFDGICAGRGCADMRVRVRAINLMANERVRPG